MPKYKQPRDDEKDLKAISDSYEKKLNHNPEYWLAEALQKDAIQNSWDARNNKDWKVKFALENTSEGIFLIIEDSGTCGLTGTIWETEAEHRQIISKEKSLTKKTKGENLAFFLSSNFSAKDSESGGKRGRGKSLFLISSKDRVFYFESLRSTDSKKVAGSMTLGAPPDTEIEVELEPKDTLKYLKDRIGDIKPLKTPGTRIFIKNPQKELVDCIKKGVLVNYIEMTWWEIIKKDNAKIVIDNGQKEFLAKTPEWYLENEIENKKLETKEYKPVVGEEKYRIKRIRLVYDPKGEIPSGFQGIGIQRNGMRIEQIPTNQIFKEEGINKIYGWLEMDKELEQKMYDLEDVEHLSFNWRKNPAKNVKEELRLKIKEFAKEVNIIEDKRAKQREADKEAEEMAANNINNYLKDLGFSGYSKDGKGKNGGGGGKKKPLRISSPELNIKNKDKRLNFGESFSASYNFINELEKPLQLKCKTWIVSEEGVNSYIEEKGIYLDTNNNHNQGFKDLKIDKERFPKGKYSLRAKMIVMENTELYLDKETKIEKGLEIEKSTAFYVEKDPENRGFLRFEAHDFDNIEKYIIPEREEKSLVIQYNTKHPYIEKVRSVGREELQRFLLEVGIIVAFNEILRDDLSEDKPKMFSDLINSEDPSEGLPRIIEEVGKFMMNQ